MTTASCLAGADWGMPVFRKDGDGIGGWDVADRFGPQSRVSHRILVSFGNWTVLMEKVNTMFFLVKFFLFIWILYAVWCWLIAPDLKSHMKAARNEFRGAPNGLLKIVGLLVRAHLIFPIRSVFIAMCLFLTLFFLG